MRPDRGLNSAGLTECQRRNLTELFRMFGGARFSIGECVELTGRNGKTVAYYLEHFTKCGIVQQFKGPGHTSLYTLTVDPKAHPEYFDLEKLQDMKAVG